MLIALATASLELGDADAAAAAATEALEIARSRTLRYYEARALEVLAQLALDRGEFDQAAHRGGGASFYDDLSSPRASELASRLPAGRTGATCVTACSPRRRESAPMTVPPAR